MLTMREDLVNQVANWELLGHPALLERFVLRNGTDFKPRKRIGRKGAAKNCFGNATKYVARNTESSYVEGFARNKEIGWMFHHAWVTTDRTDAMDPTLNSEQYDYFGILFDNDTLYNETFRNGHYGLLVSLFYNTELMFKIDPELEAICKAVRASRKTSSITITGV